MDREAYNNLDEFKQALESIGTEALNVIYVQYKTEFFNFCRKFKISDIQITDVYQDSIIAFYENVVSGKLTELNSSFKTYLFSIGKYSIYNLLKKENKIVSMDKEHIENLDLSIVSDTFDTDSKLELVQEALKNMGENCRQILVLFYYHSYTIEALMHELDYKNENVVRAHKSRCLKNLKNIIKENY